jgi:hypothetical protein
MSVVSIHQYSLNPDSDSGFAESGSSLLLYPIGIQICYDKICKKNSNWNFFFKNRQICLLKLLQRTFRLFLHFVLFRRRILSRLDPDTKHCYTQICQIKKYSSARIYRPSFRENKPKRLVFIHTTSVLGLFSRKQGL